MDSVVAVCNAALIRLKQVPLATLDNPTTKRAVTMVTLYENVRDVCLSLGFWKFAKTRATLARLAEAPSFEWPYAYQLPSDYIRMYRTYPYYYSYEIEGRKLLTSESSVSIKYIRRVTDPTQMPAVFKKLWSLMLAYESCGYLNGSEENLPRAIKRDIDELMADSLFTEACEDPPEEGEQHDQDYEWSRL